MRYLVIVIFLFSFINFRAQKYDDDAALWLNVYLEKKLNDKFDIHLNHKSRINNNISQYSMGYMDMGVTYYFTKNIKVLADYVLAERRRLNGTYSTRHQFYLALVLKKRMGRFMFSYRNMVQGQVQDIYVSDDGKFPVYYERNKFSVKYDINKRFSAYVAEELYLPFYQYTHKGMDRSRSYVGMYYNLTKKMALEAYFLYQQELNAYRRTKRDFIYGLGFSKEF